jgi:2,4-dienoyl-CoA reductase (NADPH2)
MDQVIISMGAEPDTSLADAIAAIGIETISAGDCHEVGYIEGAMLGGRKAALSLA